MATAYIPLPPLAWYSTDGSAGSVAAALEYKTTSDASDPQLFWFQWLFDAAANEHIQTQFILPTNYGSAPVMVIYYKMASATTDDVLWGVSVCALTPADAADMDADELDTAGGNELADTVPATAGYLASHAISLTNVDSMAAGDHVIFCIYRHADDAADDATGDAEFVGAEFQYTTA